MTARTDSHAAAANGPAEDAHGESVRAQNEHYFGEEYACHRPLT